MYPLGGNSTVCWRCSLAAQRSPAAKVQTLTRRRHHASKVSSSSGAQAWRRDDERHYSQGSTPITVPRASLRPKVGAWSFHTASRPPRHASRSSSTQAFANPQSGDALPYLTFDVKPENETQVVANPNSNIRQRLRQWQRDHGDEMQGDLAEILGTDKEDIANTSAKNSGRDQAYDPEGTDDGVMDDMSVMAAAEELDALDPNHRILKPGDLVEIPHIDSARDPMVAVYIRRLGFGTSESQFFTSTGKWLHTKELSVQFVVPGYIDKSMVEAILPHLPTRVSKELENQGQLYDFSVPREYSAPIVSRLLKFEHDARELYRQNATTLDQAHDLLSHPEDLKFGVISQMGRRLLNKGSSDTPLTPVELYTTRLALLRSNFGFGFDERHHRLTGFVHIRSKERVRLVAQVREWIREYRNELGGPRENAKPRKGRSKGVAIVSEFVRKARSTIEKSRANREPTALGCVGPSKVILEPKPGEDVVRHTFGSSWTQEEQDIIRYLEAWSLDRSFHRLPTADAQPSVLLHATGMYDNYKYDESLGYMFLQELGVLSPYDNRIRYSEALLVPSGQHSKPLQQLMSRLQSPNSTTSGQAPLRDTMKDLRHDWKGLPVFCVDKAGAQEIDDGLSIEETRNGDRWVRIHVANPTAFIDRESPLAKLARHMTETIYLPERNYPMLPTWVTKQNFSLKPHRPCLTFSAKLDKEGNMLDYSIESGIVHNVMFIEPKEVDAVLNTKASSGSKGVRLTVGGEAPKFKDFKPQTTASDLTKSHETMLKQLFDVAAKRFAKRSGQTGITLNSIDQNINVWVNDKAPGLPWDHPSRQTVRHYEGDPIIDFQSAEYTGTINLAGKVDANAMVRECMLLACEVAAKWCESRKVPIIYRGSLPQVTDPRNSAAAYYKRVVEPEVQRNGGTVPVHMLGQYLERSNPSTLQLQPRFHDQLGMSHFTKVTSPLRRFGDMVVHWQIEGALRDQARNKTDLTPTTGRSGALPFSPTELRQMLNTFRAREDRIKRAKFSGMGFWVAMLLFRAHYFGQAKLPEKLTAYVTQTPHLGFAPTAIMELGVSGRMAVENEQEVRVGDEWEVVFGDISPYRSTVSLKPVRLLKRVFE